MTMGENPLKRRPYQSRKEKEKQKGERRAQLCNLPAHPNGCGLLVAASYIM